MVLELVVGSRQSFWGGLVRNWSALDGGRRYHVVDDTGSFCHGARLEAHVCHVGDHFSDCDVFAPTLVIIEFDTTDSWDAFWDWR